MTSSPSIFHPPCLGDMWTNYAPCVVGILNKRILAMHQHCASLPFYAIPNQPTCMQLQYNYSRPPVFFIENGICDVARPPLAVRGAL